MSLAPDNPIHQRLAEVETIVTQVQQLSGSNAGQQIRHLVELILDLHRDALKRIIRMLGQAGPPGDSVLRGLTDDELVANLLLLHGLHPLSLEDRVKAAVEKIRPYLKSHDGDVELVDISEGSANLRMRGSCDGCPAMANSLKMVIEQAIYDAAPDLAGIHMEAVAPSAVG